jgi:hypothetical protein
MNEKNVPAKAVAKAAGIDKTREMTDSELDKVSAGHASLGESVSNVRDKVSHAKYKLSGFDPSSL